MGIQSFLKAQKGDPDWAFTPNEYFDKEFKIIDANLIELGHDKQDTVVLRQTPDEKAMLAKQLRVDVRDRGELDLTIINEAEDKLQQVFIYEIKVREQATLNLGIFAKGGKLNKHIFQVYLEEGANFNMYGYIANTVGGDTEVITKLAHKSPWSNSQQYIVTEAGKKSQTVYQCIANISNDAVACTVGIDNANLVTGDDARCHGLPEVFNDTDTARISTSVNTEDISSDQLYYLQSRGISPEEGRKMIIEGYQRQAFDIIQDTEIRSEIEQLFAV